MLKLTGLRQWRAWGCLIGLACALPLQVHQAHADAVKVAALLAAHLPPPHPCTGDVVSAQQPTPSLSPDCSLALSGLLAPLPAAPASAPDAMAWNTAPASAAPTASAAPAVTPAEEMVHQVNLLRVSKGLPPLKVNPALAAAAQDFAARMGSSNFFSHSDPENRCNRPWERMVTAGYLNWSYAAENIAAGQDTPSKAMAGFIASPSHYNTLVNPNLREIGVGLFTDQGDGNDVRLINACPSHDSTSGPYVFYWVQDFGARTAPGMPMLPIIIENEAPNTPSQDVTIYVHGGEPGQTPWVSQMRFSTDGTTWSAFEPYTAQKSMTLPRGPGLKSIYAQLKNAAGMVQTISDTIYLADDDFVMPFRTFMPMLTN